MRRPFILFLLVFAGGCHRLTDPQGDTGVFRHYNGWLLASELSMWLGFGGALLGLGFLAYYGLIRDLTRGKLAWAAVLVVIGLTAAAASWFNWAQLRITPS